MPFWKCTKRNKSITIGGTRKADQFVCVWSFCGCSDLHANDLVEIPHVLFALPSSIIK